MSKGLRIAIVLGVLAVFAAAVFLKEGGGDQPARGAVGPEQAELSQGAAGVNNSAQDPAVRGGADAASDRHEPSNAAGTGNAAVTGNPARDAQRALPRLVDLGSDKCIPCKMMAPILEELAKEYEGRMIVEVIDVRENRAAAQLYSVRVIPTQVFFDASGEELFRHEGFIDKEAILAKWGELGIDL